MVTLISEFGTEVMLVLQQETKKYENQVDSKYMMCVHDVKLKSRHLYKSYVIGHTQMGMRV